MQLILEGQVKEEMISSGRLLSIWEKTSIPRMAGRHNPLYPQMGKLYFLPQSAKDLEIMTSIYLKNKQMELGERQDPLRKSIQQEKTKVPFSTKMEKPYISFLRQVKKDVEWEDLIYFTFGEMGMLGPNPRILDTQ